MTSGLRRAVDLYEGELKPPDYGTIVELAPGLLWTRVPVPMSVRHVNIYLLEDDGAWAIIDAGFGDADNFDTWEKLINGPLKGERFTRLIVTHGHIDHVGAAGWLCRRLNLPLFMTEIEYFATRMELADPNRLRKPFYAEAFRRMGAGEELIKTMADHASRYSVGVGPLPENFHPLIDHQTIRIGRRDFQIFLGPGHSPGQALLYSAAENLFFCADHMLNKVPPLLIVPVSSLEDDTYGRYRRSLDELERDIRPDVTILPAHNLPHSGLAATLELMRKHHGNRLEMIVNACAKKPHTVLEMAYLLFGHKLNGRQTHYAIFEALAYLNHALQEGRMVRVASGSGPQHYSLA